MRATLILGAAHHNNPRVRQYRLRVDTSDSRSRYGFGVLKYGRDRMLDGFNFRWLRVTNGAVIVTDDVAAVSRALGVPHDEPGIIAGTL